MGLIDLISLPGQQIAYLFPEVVEINRMSRRQSGGASLGAGEALNDVFVFQFWPSQVQDRYQPTYATKGIPGASHPLYQYVGGGGRTISFDATFVAELDEGLDNPGEFKNFRERVATTATISANPRITNAISATLLPSSRYTVNVAAAIAALQRYLYPRYSENSSRKGIVKAPGRLVLVLPNTSLGRAEGEDGVLCVLLRADVTMESWFPSGRLRAATVALEFAEVIQHSDGEGSLIRYIGADQYDDLARQYTISGRGLNKVTI